MPKYKGLIGVQKGTKEHLSEILDFIDKFEVIQHTQTAITGELIEQLGVSSTAGENLTRNIHSGTNGIMW